MTCCWDVCIDPGRTPNSKAKAPMLQCVVLREWGLWKSACALSYLSRRSAWLSSSWCQLKPLDMATISHHLASTAAATSSPIVQSRQIVSELVAFLGDPPMQRPTRRSIWYGIPILAVCKYCREAVTHSHVIEIVKIRACLRVINMIKRMIYHQYEGVEQLSLK